MTGDVPEPADRGDGPGGRARAPRGRAIARASSILVGLGLTVAPALAETRGTAAVTRAFDSHRTSVERFSIDLHGLTLRGIERDVAGRRVRVGEVAIALGTSGLDIVVREIGVGSAVRPAAPTNGPAAVARSVPAPVSRAPDLIPQMESWRTQVRGLARVPISLSLATSTDLPVGTGSAAIRSAFVTIDAQGLVKGNAKARFDRGEGARGEADVAFNTTLAADAPLMVAANVTGDERLGQFGVDAEVVGTLVGARIVHGDGGALVELDREGRRDGTLRVHAETMSIGWLGTAARVVGAGQALVGIDLERARLDGSVQVKRREGRLDISFDETRVSDVTVKQRSLARDPIHIEALTLSGSGRLEAGSIEFDGRIQHGDATIQATVSASEAAYRLGIALEPIECQTLLASMPRGFMTVLEGMRVAGEVGGNFSLDVDRTDLERYRADEASAGALDELRPPGRVDFGLPVLDACSIVEEPPGVDVQSLRGPYRHQFVADDGTSRDRVLATGAPGFINAAAAARVAASFVVLEDARFYLHDGFDRAQIERALWHNIAHGRVDRGASTISQQAARNLWLGIDRSISRKLQEAFLTAHLERHVDKRRILEIYLSIIELGPAVHGVVDAAWFHFGRSVTSLNTVEALHLASLAPSPAPYSSRFETGEVDPTWRAALTEQARRLRIHGYIGAHAASLAARQPLRLLDRTER